MAVLKEEACSLIFYLYLYAMQLSWKMETRRRTVSMIQVEEEVDSVDLVEKEAMDLEVVAVAGEGEEMETTQKVEEVVSNRGEVGEEVVNALTTGATRMEGEEGEEGGSTAMAATTPTVELEERKVLLDSLGGTRA